MNKIILLLALSCISLYISGQRIISGIGKCYYKDISGEDNARNIALMQAQKNALINYGGHISASISSTTVDEIKKIKDTNKKVKFMGQNISGYYAASEQYFSGIVSTYGNPEYIKGQDIDGKYIRVKGQFNISEQEVNKFVNNYISANKAFVKIFLKLKLNNYDSYKQSKCINDFFREYFNNPYANYEFVNRKGKGFVVIELIQTYSGEDKFTINLYIKNYDGIFKTYNFWIDDARKNYCRIAQFLDDDGGYWEKIRTEIYGICISEAMNN
jgi:hypothetical protein